MFFTENVRFWFQNSFFGGIWPVMARFKVDCQKTDPGRKNYNVRTRSRKLEFDSFQEIPTL